MRCLSVCVLILAFFQLSAQNISGTIHIKGSKAGVPGAHVFVVEPRVGTVTNDAGSFSLGLLPGLYTFEVSSIGFESVSREIEVGQEDLIINIAMVESIIEMPEVVVSRMTMTGGLSRVADIPGSAHYLGPRDLNKFSYGDVNRVLRNIPGINMQEEDGFGLRPNIGMRGTGTERSSKITVMEDGILMAPAPYAAPAAYYFPYVGRMQGVEVRKGSSTIKYGPYTTGGALNLISTQIPNNIASKIDLSVGNFGQRTLLANVGVGEEHFGFLAETYQAHADGFKRLDGGGDTGFNISDYHFKLRLSTSRDAKVYQALNFKALSSTEQSNETYLGLTDSDFALNPLRRYAGSQMDVMDAAHKHFSLTHVIRPARFIDITTTVYQTDFKRNWYKLDKVRSQADSNAVSISSILEDPVRYRPEYDIITGSDSPNDNALLVKNNNRSYYSKGVQTMLGLNFSGHNTKHDIEIGFRFHTDEMDRFQWVDEYKMNEGKMMLTTSGIPGTESNRIESASAAASYLQYTLQFKGLTVIPGMRYENIEISRDDFGKNDPDRQGTDLQSRSNLISAWVPGIGAQYQVNQNLNLFVGAHKGFSPPGSRTGTNPEESFNYELGFRTNVKGVFFNGTGFFNDYKNLLGVDLAAAGGTGGTDLFNGGAATVYGLEFEFQFDLLQAESHKFSLPAEVIYTYTKGIFDTSFSSEFEGWGAVSDGDEMPYLSNHQLLLNFGLVHPAFEINMNTRYTDPMRTRPGQGELEPTTSTDSQFVLDLSANIKVVDHITFFGSIRNITNSTYIVARRPAGVRPGMPRSFQLGIKASL